MAEVSQVDIKYKVDILRHDLCLEETEDNWEKIAKAIQAFTSIAEKGGYELAPTEVINAVRNFHRPMTNAMNSERTRLCGTALDMLPSLANGLGHDFDQLMPLFMPTLLNICGRTNKVVINRARAAIFNIIESTQLASVLPFFVQNVKDKAATLRLVIAEGTLACLNSCNPPDLEKEARARDVETIIRGTARDANPDVRKVSRKIFESYKILFPSRVESFTAPLSPTMKKYLDIKPTTVAAKSLISSKSTSNLQERSEVTVKARGHMRTASASTTLVSSATQSKNLAAKLTRVVRKEQNSRPESQKSNPSRPPSSTSTATGPIRTTSHYTTSAAPVRNHPNATSRLASAIPTTSTDAITVVPRRLHATSSTKSSVGVQQPSVTCGPRRVLMPPPAPKKEQDCQKQPPSRVDSSASTNKTSKECSTSLARPPARTTKAASITVRPAKTKPPVPKFQPTSNSNSTSTASAPTVRPTSTKTITTVKPLMINKVKPVWGRVAPSTTKGAPSAVQKAAAKFVIKKPSSLVSKTSTTITVQDPVSVKRPITPAMIALPPSPTRSEPKDRQADETEGADQAENMLPESRSVPQEHEVEEEDIDKTIYPDTQAHTSASVSPADSRLSTPISEGSGCVMNVDSAEKSPNHNPDLFGEDQAIFLTPESNPLLKPHDAATVHLSAKTPISALLSSIERGFLYSPTTPLSPADAYLPGPNGTIAYRHETHAPRVDGSMQPFNHALHVMNPGEMIFGKVNSAQESDVTEISLGV